MTTGIDFWYYEVGINIIAADTVNKKPTSDSWKALQTSELEEVAYLANKASGKYDQGIAIICGMIWRGPNKGKWLNGIDLDNEIAIKAFGQKPDDLMESHEDDPNSVHVYFITDEPIQSKALDKKFFDPKLQPAIEIKSGGDKIMYCYPSNHGTVLPDGTKAIKQWVLNRFEQPPCVNKKELEEFIDKICAKYNIDYLKNRSVKQKVRERNKIPEGQRHNDLLTEANNIWHTHYSAYENGKITKDQIFNEFLKIADRCDPKHDDADIERVFNDAEVYVLEGRNKEDSPFNEGAETKSEYAPKSPFSEGCVYFRTNENPLTFIGGTEDYRIIEKEAKYSKGVFIGWNTKTFLACKIVEITKHRNILEFLELPERYTINFEGKEVGKFSLKQKTLSQIVSFLKNTVALSEGGLDNAIIAQILGFKSFNRLKENDETNMTGFLIANQNSKHIIPTNTDISGTTIEELRTALEYIDELAKVGFKNRLDLLGHNIKFAVIAPCSFVFKVIKAPLLHWMCLYGKPNSGKSTSGLIILAVDSHHEDTEYNVGGTSVDNMTRLAEAIRFTTFPKMLDELDFVNNKYLPHNVKIAVDDIIVRTIYDRSRNKEPILGLSACIMTSNSPPPFHNGAFMKRVPSRYFPDNETHIPTEKECKVYDDTLLDLHKLSALGRFRNRFVMENQDMILDKRLSAFDKSKNILIAAYEYADMLVPCWLIKQQLAQTQLEESIIDAKEIVSNAIKNLILAKFKYANKIDDLQHYKEYALRFIQCISWGVLTFARMAENGDIILNSGFVKELYEYGVTKDELPNLKALGDSMQGFWSREHGGRHVIRITQKELFEYFEENQ